jgi:hypothetical protein
MKLMISPQTDFFNRDVDKWGLLHKMDEYGWSWVVVKGENYWAGENIKQVFFSF